MSRTKIALQEPTQGWKPWAMICNRSAVTRALPGVTSVEFSVALSPLRRFEVSPPLALRIQMLIQLLNCRLQFLLAGSEFTGGRFRSERERLVLSFPFRLILFQEIR